MNEAGDATYKDLLVWQNSMMLANAVIDMTELLESSRKPFRLVEQLDTAATSVPMNIVEGKAGILIKKSFYSGQGNPLA